MEVPNQPTQPTKNFSYPDQIRSSTEQIVSTVKIIAEIPKSIATLRRTFRGEALYQTEEGESHWIQVVKPAFIKLNPLTREPIMQEITMPDGEKKMVFVPNDEAIEEILSQLFFMGMNQITPLTDLDENIIIDDLREFECKLSGLLCLKQVNWGLDKALMPMIMSKIKTVVQDARYMCVGGGTIKRITEQVSRIEQVLEGGEKLKKMTPSPY